MRGLLATTLDDAGLHYRLGHMLLEQKDDQGVSHLEKSVGLGQRFRYNYFQELYDYYVRKKDHERAQRYLQEANDSAQELLNAAIAAMTVTEDETFEPHTVSPFKLERINNALFLEPRVKQAWLLKRTLPPKRKKSSHVLLRFEIYRNGDVVSFAIDYNVQEKH